MTVFAVARLNEIGLSDLPEALAALTIAEDGCPIEIERPAPDVPAFEAGAPHAGFYPFNDQVAFEFSHRANDGSRWPGPAIRPLRLGGGFSEAF